ncbi:uncharacterized protein VDAG_09426 [Verticillium dahliae VdLs.17]|uniref:Autophagy-related protein 9 n=2 Tax=Verticillium dahliae TaxID=27337 RepID=G2XGZ4_VERDV|nr:uncharacterized protein VDAG_09426 [Verticillium dahliae VdLs.17]EGY19092.1 hypothetical protein VDAG_09426 [Verticillium dahliae VdLs.17]KAH6688646.1 autophagy protein Apg9-domain-containing protein [Verticillium dahliae]
MASNLFSRDTVPGRVTKSFYEELRGASREDEDIENNAGADLDENNWNQHFLDQDLDGLAIEDSRTTADGTANLVRQAKKTPQNRPAVSNHWHGSGREDEGDNDVPASLLVEANEAEQIGKSTHRKQLPATSRRHKPPGQPSRQSQAQWERAQSQQRLYHELPLRSPGAKPSTALGGVVSGSPREQALWRWINVSNLDFFMRDVYEYYLGSGFWCILCERALHLVQSTFITIFLTFLTQCIEYNKVPGSSSLSQIITPQCTKKMSWYWNLGLWLFVFYFIWKAVQFSVDTRRLITMRNFYVHLLEIPEQDMQTVSWQDIVARIMALRDANPNTALNMTRTQRDWIRAHSKERLDAVDIASRLMRKDNYLIAMINKDVLDMTLPIPFMQNRQFFSGTLQWWLYFSVIDLIFDQSGQVNQEFLKSDRRGLLSRKLRDRFVCAGLLNLLCTPFWIGYQTVIHLLNYYNEYKKNSATLGDRRYTALARWKFREFNELPHLFQERINMSYPFASRYIDQFPKRLVEQVARSVTFMSGAITFTLAAASFLDPELFLGFEITKDRTALFYIGVFGTIWALARGMISEETTVFDPEFALKGVLDFTHHMPDHWQGRLHSFDVKQEFSELYKLKVVILAEEILGIFLASFVLLFSAPKSSDQIIDFVREFTIHVDGLGYVCSFAEFDFRRGLGNQKPTAGVDDVREDYYTTKHGKMAASYYGFLENYVINPKTGMPGGHVPPSMRQQFHPPPAFPGLNSPNLAAEIPGSREGRGETSRGRGLQGGLGHPARTPRFGASMTAPSPMASMLLDPHHQPSGTNLNVRSTYGIKGRQHRGEHPPELGIREEPTEEGMSSQLQSYSQREDEEEAGGPLGESVWQTSPAKNLGRESSGALSREPDTGVLGLIQQFQQAQRNNRLGGA